MFTYTHYTIYNKWSLDIKTAVIGWFCWICIQTQISVTLIVLLEFNIQWLLNEWCSPWAPTRIYFLTHKGLWSRTAPKLLHPPPTPPFNDQYHLLLYIWLVYLPVLYTGNYNHLNIRIIPSTDSTHSYMYPIPPEFSNFIINIISINKCTVIYTKVYRLETTEWFWTFHIDKVHECISSSLFNELISLTSIHMNGSLGGYKRVELKRRRDLWVVV